MLKSLRNVFSIFIFPPVSPSLPAKLFCFLSLIQITVRFPILKIEHFKLWIILKSINVPSGNICHYFSFPSGLTNLFWSLSRGCNFISKPMTYSMFRGDISWSHLYSISSGVTCLPRGYIDVFLGAVVERLYDASRIIHYSLLTRTNRDQMSMNILNNNTMVPEEGFFLQNPLFQIVHG